MKTLDRQKELEIKLEELLMKRASLKGLSNKSKYAEVEIEIKEVNHNLRLVTKHLCRCLLENPNINVNLKKSNKERNFLEGLLSDTIIDVQNGSFTTINRQIDAENKERNRVQELMRHEEEIRDEVDKLQDTLSREKLNHQKNMAEKNKTLKLLKEELRQVTRETVNNYTYARKTARAKINTILFEYQTEETMHDRRLNDLKNDKDKEALVHEEVITYLSRKQKDYEELLKEWNKKYINDMAEMDKTIKMLANSRDKDLEELNHLQDRYDSDLAEKTAQEEEKRQYEEIENLKLSEFERDTEAVLKIQKCWREYKAFKEMKAKLLPKKKKRRRRKKSKK